MRMSRRKAVQMLAGMVPAIKLAQAFGQDAVPGPSTSPASPVQATIAAPQIEPGIFEGTAASLSKHTVPDWWRDAKLGLWAHWGPQSAAEHGDWYARFMYMPRVPDIPQNDSYKYHCETYGHPSKFGFKDVITTWKADKFDPNYLVGLYKKTGCKFFMSMGVHHDNFDLWDSKYTRWNSVNMGPRGDIVGEFKKAALANDLKFGISDHLWISYKWFGVE